MAERAPALLPLACQGTDPDSSAFQDEGWTASPEPVVVIGGADEREGYLLQRVAGATRLSDGRIVIADGGSAEISFYDSLGTHLTTVRGKERAPGSSGASCRSSGCRAIPSWCSPTGPG